MILDRWFEQRAGTSSLQSPASWLVDLLSGGPTASGKSVTEESSLQLPTVFSCVRILSEAMIIAPLNLYRINGRMREEARGHPLWKIFHLAANSEMTPATWHEVSQMHRSLWGNSYSLIARNKRGDVAELLPLQPSCTFPERKSDGKIWYNSTVNGQSWTFPARDILHIKALGGDGLVGWSPIRCQREQVGMMMAQQEFSGKFYKNGATLSGIIKAPGKMEDKASFAQAWDKFVGSDRAFKTAVLDQGLDYQSIGIPPEDAQFLETQKYSDAQIANLFRVPVHMLNQLDRVTFNNIEHLGIQFVQHTMMAWYRKVEQECALKLLRPQDSASLKFKFNVNALMRGDFKTRTEGYSKGLGGPGSQGWMTINDVRELEDMNPIDEGDEIIKAGMQEAEPPAEEPTVEENNGLFANSIAERTHEREFLRLSKILESSRGFDDMIPQIAKHWSMAYGMSDTDARNWSAELVCNITKPDAVFDRKHFGNFIKEKMTG